jgi:hypothetical protein
MTAILSYDAKLTTSRICWSFAQDLSGTLRNEFVSAYSNMQKNMY